MATISSHIDNYDQSAFWPAVEKSLAASQHLKVADLACGNGVWLTELHSNFAKNNISAQLDGFDINPENFPAAAFLPASVSLKQLDILRKPLPAELIGIYDVVHIRAFVSVILDSDLTPVLSVASELLKPGGFLQWEEVRGDNWVVEAPSPEVSKSACESIVQVLQGSMRARGISNDWVDVPDTHLAQFGFQNTQLLVQEKRKQDYKGWTEDYLMVWAEIVGLFPPKAEAPNAPLSREAWMEMFSNSVAETEQGVVVHQGRVITAVGQKPQ